MASTVPIPPEYGMTKFQCPQCGVLSLQFWYYASKNLEKVDVRAQGRIQIAISECVACNEIAIWRKGKLVDPMSGIAPAAAADMPDDVREVYDEANAVSGLSPRAAAALLRLGLQKLCLHVGGKGKDINEDIRELVKKGLSPIVQQSLDIVRVTGNNAVHPGQIDVDDASVVAQLFLMLNLVVETMITVPKQIETIYASLPESSRKAVERRDAGSS